MKTLILLSLIMVGCIVEPRPENNEFKPITLAGKWQSANYQTVYIYIEHYTIDSIFNGSATGVAQLRTDSGGLQDKRYIHSNDTLRINFKFMEEAFVRN